MSPENKAGECPFIEERSLRGSVLNKSSLEENENLKWWWLLIGVGEGSLLLLGRKETFLLPAGSMQVGMNDTCISHLFMVSKLQFSVRVPYHIFTLFFQSTLHQSRVGSSVPR